MPSLDSTLTRLSRVVPGAGPATSGRSLTRLVHGSDGDRLHRIGFRVALLGFLAMTLFPLYYLFVLSITPNNLIGPVIPPAVSLRGYTLSLARFDWALAAANSVFLTVSSTRRWRSSSRSRRSTSRWRSAC